MYFVPYIYTECYKNYIAEMLLKMCAFSRCTDRVYVDDFCMQRVKGRETRYILKK